MPTSIFNILLIFCPNNKIRSSSLIFFNDTHLYFSPFKNLNSFEEKNVSILLFNKISMTIIFLKAQAHDLIISGIS
jgi:hypothetical protein